MNNQAPSWDLGNQATCPEGKVAQSVPNGHVSDPETNLVTNPNQTVLVCLILATRHTRTVSYIQCNTLAVLKGRD